MLIILEFDSLIESLMTSNVDGLGGGGCCNIVYLCIILLHYFINLLSIRTAANTMIKEESLVEEEFSK